VTEINCSIVEEYNRLPEIAINLDIVARMFRTIECGYSKWEELKVVHDKLANGLLKSMVVALLARSAKTKSQLETTLKLCDKYNPGPANMALKRLKEEFNV